MKILTDALILFVPPAIVLLLMFVVTVRVMSRRQKTPDWMPEPTSNNILLPFNKDVLKAIQKKNQEEIDANIREAREAEEKRRKA